MSLSLCDQRQCYVYTLVKSGMYVLYLQRLDIYCTLREKGSKLWKHVDARSISRAFCAARFIAPRFYSPLFPLSRSLFSHLSLSSDRLHRYGSSSSISRQWPIQYPRMRGGTGWHLSDNERRAEERVKRDRSETQEERVCARGGGGGKGEAGKTKPAAGRLLFFTFEVAKRERWGGKTFETGRIARARASLIRLKMASDKFARMPGRECYARARHHLLNLPVDN